jgi:hypothetical protein
MFSNPNGAAVNPELQSGDIAVYQGGGIEAWLTSSNPWERRS